MTNIEKDPFLKIIHPQPIGPGSYEMAFRLMQAVNIKPGMRVLEIGAGSGQVAVTLAKHWNVNVVTLEPWESLDRIHQYAFEEGVSNQVLALNITAQELPFANEIFDAVISIGSFEMIGEERTIALTEMIRVTKKDGRIGIAEPMCTTEEIPLDILKYDAVDFYKQYFRTVEWNSNLFCQCGLTITENYYFSEGYQWWVDNLRYYDGDKDLILEDGGRWLSLGLVVGQK